MKLLEEARWQIYFDKGRSIEELLKLAKAPVILEANLKYLRELLYNEDIEISTTFTNRKGKIGHVIQNIYKNSNQLVLEARFVFGIMNLEARRLIEISDEWWSWLGGSD